jgi:hypothetical protein
MNRLTSTRLSEFEHRIKAKGSFKSVSGDNKLRECIKYQQSSGNEKNKLAVGNRSEFQKAKEGIGPAYAAAYGYRANDSRDLVAAQGLHANDSRDLVTAHENGLNALMEWQQNGSKALVDMYQAAKEKGPKALAHMCQAVKEKAPGLLVQFLCAQVIFGGIGGVASRPLKFEASSTGLVPIGSDNIKGLNPVSSESHPMLIGSDTNRALLQAHFPLTDNPRNVQEQSDRGSSTAADGGSRKLSKKERVRARKIQKAEQYKKKTDETRGSRSTMTIERNKGKREESNELRKDVIDSLQSLDSLQGEAQGTSGGETSRNFRSRKMTLGGELGQVDSKLPEWFKVDKEQIKTLKSLVHSLKQNEAALQGFRMLLKDKEAMDGIINLMQNEEFRDRGLSERGNEKSINQTLSLLEGMGSLQSFAHSLEQNETALQGFRMLLEDKEAMEGMRNLLQDEAFRERGLSELRDEKNVTRALSLLEKEVSKGTCTEWYKKYTFHTSALYHDCCKDPGNDFCQENQKVDGARFAAWYTLPHLLGWACVGCCCCSRKLEEDSVESHVRAFCCCPELYCIEQACRLACFVVCGASVIAGGFGAAGVIGAAVGVNVVVGAFKQCFESSGQRRQRRTDQNIPVAEVIMPQRQNDQMRPEPPERMRMGERQAPSLRVYDQMWTQWENEQREDLKGRLKSIERDLEGKQEEVNLLKHQQDEMKNLPAGDQYTKGILQKKQNKLMQKLKADKAKLEGEKTVLREELLGLPRKRLQRQLQQCVDNVLGAGSSWNQLSQEQRQDQVLKLRGSVLNDLHELEEPTRSRVPRSPSGAMETL